MTIPGSVLLLAALLFVSSAYAEGTSTSTDTETSTWKKVDKSLSEGVKTIKKKFMDADDKPAEKKPEKKTENGKELEKITDSLNEVWDNSLKGVGKLLKTQQTDNSTSTHTNSRTTVTVTRTTTVTSTATH